MAKKTEQLIYVGIDNGISGACTVLAGKTIFAWTAMPCQTTRKGTEVNVKELYRWLHETIPSQQLNRTTFTVEEPGGAKSYTAAVSMAASFHSIRAMLDLMQVRWHRITPATWQKVMLPGCEKGDTKRMALEMVGRLWPLEDWLRTSKCSTPNSGAVDAALIAEYSRQKQL